MVKSIPELSVKQITADLHLPERAGVGVDMLEISRMHKALTAHASFQERVFTSEERAYCNKTKRPAEHYAARFAAREATLKALGCGFDKGIGLKDVSVTLDAKGKPQIVLAGGAAARAHELGISEIELSLSHTREIAQAIVVTLTKNTRPQKDEKPDPKKELAASFREARAIINDLERISTAPDEPKQQQLSLDESK